MPRTDEATSFYHSVYSAIQEIPYGKVTTYGHIARLIGTPNRPRQVGICLKHLPSSPSPSPSPSTSTSTTSPTPTPLFHNGNVPWQRVINTKGGISPRYVFYLVLSSPSSPSSFYICISISLQTNLKKKPPLGRTKPSRDST
ncbi:hypothetical protein BHYA_0351g00010 [Botrytis hyacinthi]|uniref:Methylated-DNA-[protein]-cysteine S-methyltransferase DNA binding domain-containing protein n=1 Tax=Botrytis hyacinthi TaxID=278943 RepID=A0A4Z1GDR5_9HELO|nr:hypothetical protein BHYA_0351g00010 [Botrytis hyacinthi]